MLQARHNAEEIYSLHAVLRQPGGRNFKQAVADSFVVGFRMLGCQLQQSAATVSPAVNSHS